LPNQAQTKQYINDLIFDYNNLVIFHYSLNPNFNSFKSNFALYNDSTNSFQIIVVQTVPNATNSITLIFKPISVSQPEVFFDYNDTFEGLYSGNAFGGLNNTNFIFENIAVQYGNSLNEFPLAIGVPSTNITTNIASNAQIEANNVFQNDVRFLPANINSIQTSTSNIMSNQKPFYQNPITWVLGAIVTLVLAGIPLYFGSYREFVRVLGDKKEQKTVLHEITRLMRHKVKNQKNTKSKKGKE
jgi:hypothetical protein